MILRTIFFTIKEPCHEGWENMANSEKGKFCSSCQKEVHDFTQATKDEIMKAYVANNGALCGHVPVKFLQEEYADSQVKKLHFTHLKRFWLAAVFCFGASLFSIDAAKASSFYKLKLSFLNLAIEAKDTIIVKGMVKDKAGEGIPFAFVFSMVNDTVVSKTTTDINGEYQLKISKKYNKVDIKADCMGYTTKIIKNVDIAPDKQIVVDLNLESDLIYITDGMMIMSDPIITDEPKPSGKTIRRKELKKMPH
jgi:hypothetical protein